MRVHFYWPECRLDYGQMAWSKMPRGAFWVSVEFSNLQLVGDHLEFTADREMRRKLEEDDVNDDLYKFGDQVYFFVPYIVDPTDTPQLGERFYPYSGMWQGRRPWLPLGPPNPDHPAQEPEGVEIAELGELKQLRYDIHNRYHLAPSAA